VPHEIAASSDVHLKTNNLESPDNVSRDLQHLVATGLDCICEKNPFKLVFKYTGNTCEQSSNSQPDKFTCTGKSAIANIERIGAYLVFSEKDDQNSYAGGILFQGWVKTGDTFEFNNGGDIFPG